MVKKDYEIIKSDETLFDIIEALEERGESGVRELADAVGKSRSVVHRHLTTLAEYGFAVNNDGKYRLSFRFLSTGTKLRRRSDLYQAAKNEVDEFATEYNIRTWCVDLEENMGVYIYGNPGGKEFLTGRIGRRYHLHQTAAGKSILAFLSEEKVEEIIDDHGLPPKTDQTITDKETLLSELETIREEKIAYNQGESEVGLRAIGAPILDENESPVGAVSASDPTHRMEGKLFNDEYPALIEAMASEISLNIIHGDSRD